MKSKLFLFCAILCVLSSRAQYTFLKIYDTPTNDHARNGRVLMDGSLVISGYRDQYNDGLVIQTNAHGDTLWSRTYPQMMLQAIAESADTSIIIAGTHTLTGQMYLGKVSRHGQMLWQKVLSDTNYVNPYEIVRTSDKGFLICGSVYPPQLSYCNASIHKVDSTGNLQWSAVLNSSVSTGAISAVELSNGDVMASCSLESTGSLFHTLLYRINNAGNVIWIKKYSASGNANTHGGARLLADGPAHLLALVTEGNSGTLMRIDTSGNILMAKRYSNAGSVVNLSNFSRSGNGIVMSGAYTSSASTKTSGLLIKTDLQGDTVFTKRYRPHKNFTSFINVFGNTSGGYVLFGETSGVSFVYNDFCAITTDSLGVITCSILPAPVQVSVPVFSIAPFPLTVYTTPGFTTTPIQQSIALVGAFTECELCIAPASPNDMTPSAKKTGCGPNSFSLNANGAGTLQWYSTATSTLALASGTTFVTPVLTPGNYTFYVEATTCTNSAVRTAVTLTVQNCTFLDEYGLSGTLSIWPNPTRNLTNIEFHGALPDHLQLIDASGRLIKELEPKSNPVNIQTSELSAGIFFIKATYSSRSVYSKLIVIE